MRLPNLVNLKLFVLLFLFIGAALRIEGLGQMDVLLDYDEAYYGLDALSLLHHPQLTPFFEGNGGRESLWMYVLTPALAVFGATPFALRLTAIFASILTLAAVHRLSRELFDARTALWSLAVLAVLYWHVHLSHIAFRAILYPLVGALAFAFMIRAWRSNRLRDWLLAGFFLGLLPYTYFAARLWVMLGGLIVLFWAVVRRQRGALAAGIIAGFMMLPLGLYTLYYPDIALGRVEDQAALTPEAVFGNIGLWLNAWFSQGSLYSFHNLRGRPILDLPLGVLGIAGLALVRRREWIFLLLLALLAVLPSLISKDAPHYLRAVGLVIPVAIFLGCGASYIEKARRLTWLPPLLLVMAGIHSGINFQTWVSSFRFEEGIQRRADHVNQVIEILKKQHLPVRTAATTPAYPIFDFLVDQVYPQPLEIFDFPGCTIGPSTPFVLVDGLNEPDAARWAQLTPLLDRSAEQAQYAVYAAVPYSGDLLGEFADLFRVHKLDALPPVASDMTFKLLVSPLAHTTQPTTLFIHLYPVDEDRVLAQTDVPICPDYPPTRWGIEYSAALTIPLHIPDDLPAADYRVVVGIYDSITLARLAEYVEIGRIHLS